MSIDCRSPSASGSRKARRRRRLPGSPPTWTDFYDLRDRSAAIALLVVLAGGLPLAVISLVVHHWPWLFGPLSRNETVVWICLTLQMTNVMLPSFFILLFASDGLDAEILTAIVTAMLYAIPNVAATGVWRELLNRLHIQARAAGPGSRPRLTRRLLGLPLQVNNMGSREFDRLIKAAGVKRITIHGLPAHLRHVDDSVRRTAQRRAEAPRALES